MVSYLFNRCDGLEFLDISIIEQMSCHTCLPIACISYILVGALMICSCGPQWGRHWPSGDLLLYAVRKKALLVLLRDVITCFVKCPT